MAQVIIDVLNDGGLITVHQQTGDIALGPIADYLQLAPAASNLTYHTNPSECEVNVVGQSPFAQAAAYTFLSVDSFTTPTGKTKYVVAVQLDLSAFPTTLGEQNVEISVPVHMAKDGYGSWYNAGSTPPPLNGDPAAVYWPGFWTAGAEDIPEILYLAWFNDMATSLEAEYRSTASVSKIVIPAGVVAEAVANAWPLVLTFAGGAAQSVVTTPEVGAPEAYRLSGSEVDLQVTIIPWAAPPEPPVVVVPTSVSYTQDAVSTYTIPAASDGAIGTFYTQDLAIALHPDAVLPDGFAVNGNTLTATPEGVTTWLAGKTAGTLAVQMEAQRGSSYVTKSFWIYVPHTVFGKKG